MDINVQIFTGSCDSPAKDFSTPSVLEKLKRIMDKAAITSAIIGWNTELDISDIASFLKQNGAEVYLWLPIFSELDALSGFSPIIGNHNEELAIQYDLGNNERFRFYCPADRSNLDRIVSIYEKYYHNEIYDGVFLDKIRFPSFIGGAGSVFGCFCSYCRSHYELSGIQEVISGINRQSANPLGISSYKNLRYEMEPGFQKLFDYKCDVIFHSVQYLHAYFKGLGLKLGLDLFSPFLSYFVGQDYHRLFPLADMVKPMFYRLTKAPAGLPFEIDMYAAAFGGDTETVQKRKDFFTGLLSLDIQNDCVGIDFINAEISGINGISSGKRGTGRTKLYAGMEFNYDKQIAPVTKEYIEENVHQLRGADGIVMSWDLSKTPANHIDYLFGIENQAVLS